MGKNELRPVEDIALGQAIAKFGDIEDLSVMQRSAVEMGYMYAKRHWLGDYYMADPEIQVTCIELAQVRKQQMVLMLQRERDLERIALEEGVSYEQAVFLAVSRQTHKAVNAELTRLSDLGGRRTNQLIIISENLGLTPETLDDAVEQTVRRILENEHLIEGEMDYMSDEYDGPPLDEAIAKGET